VALSCAQIRRFAFLNIAIAQLTVAVPRMGAADEGIVANDKPIVALRFSAEIDEARVLMIDLVKKTQSPGLTIAVIVDGSLVWSEAYGVSDLDKATPTTRETGFKIASVSKLITVAVLAKLYEAGKIDLDAPLGTYVSSYPDLERHITARLLSGHLAGIRHYNGFAETVSRQHCNRMEEALTVFQKDPLLHDPGSKYSYSSFGYVLLSAGLEGAAEKPFEALVEELVVMPLKLVHTQMNPPKDHPLVSQTAEYWMNGQNRVVPNLVTDLSCRLAAGGAASTAEDLVRFAAAHVGGRYLKPGTVEMLFTSQKLPDGKETGVGIGWRISRDEIGRKFVHHGGTGGGRAFVLLYPSEDVAIALCSNLGNAAFAEKEAQAIATPFLDSSR